MRKKLYIIATILLFVSSAAASCEPLRQNGSPNEKIDLLLVGGEDYSNTSIMEEDFNYYVGKENRGMFDVYPMNVTSKRFNIWYVFGRENSSTTSGDRGPLKEAEHWLEECSDMEYSVFMAKTNHDWAGGALNKVARVDGISDKVDEENGAVGLIHEWGHLFGNVADEYNYGEGKYDASKPNCARNQTQAENWWGEMSSLTDKVGYEEGCKGSENIEAHPGPTIMGDGGLWSYGPVNDRQMLRIITEQTEPVTDISVESYTETNQTINANISWNRASNVVVVKAANQTVDKIFAYKTGSKEISFQKPEGPYYQLKIDTLKDVGEVSEDNNAVDIGEPVEPNKNPRKPYNLEPENGSLLTESEVELEATYNDPDENSGKIEFYNQDDTKIGECTTIETEEKCSFDWEPDSGKNEWYAVSSDGNTTNRSETRSFYVDRPPEIFTLNPTGGAEIDGKSVELTVFVEDPDSDDLEVKIFNSSTRETFVEKNVESDQEVTAIIENLEQGAIYNWYATVNDGNTTERTDEMTFRTSKPEKLNFTVTPEILNSKAVNNSNLEKTLEITNHKRKIETLKISSENLKLEADTKTVEKNSSKNITVNINNLTTEQAEITLTAESGEKTEIRNVQIQTEIYENHSSRIDNLKDNITEIEDPGVKNRIDEAASEAEKSWQEGDYKKAIQSYETARSLANSQESENNIEKTDTSGNILSLRNIGIAFMLLFVIFTLSTSIVPE